MRMCSTFTQKICETCHFALLKEKRGGSPDDSSPYDGGSVFRRGELDYQVHIVGLNLCLVCRLVSDRLAAPLAAVDDDIALLRVGHSTYGAKNAAALVGSVTGIHVNVKR